MAKREGYLMIDHRASPGLPAEVARQQGLDPAVVGEGKLFEVPTLTCAHCKTSAIKNPWRTRPRHSCYKCGVRFICDACALRASMPDYDHTPFEKVVEISMKGPLPASLQYLFGHTPVPLTKSKETI